jgi:two-component system sensor kinase FixL
VFRTSCFFELASDLSSRFANIAPERVDDELRSALRSMIEFFEADYCALFKALEGDDRIEVVQAVGTENLTLPHSSFNAKKLFPWLFSEVVRNKTSLSLHTLDELPDTAAKDRECLEHWAVKSVLLIPLPTAATLTHAVALAAIRSEQSWTKNHIPQLRLLADILANAMSRRSMQEALQRTRRDLVEAQRICRLGSWQWDIASGDIVASEAVDRIFGLKLGTQASFMELVHPADRCALQKAIDIALSREGKKSSIEYRIRTRRGDIRNIRSHFEMIRSESGARAIGTFQDVTDVRKSEQELQLLRSQHWHADRISRTGVLVASLAHELSQPLAAILSNAQAGLRFMSHELSHEPLDEEEIRDILKDIVADNKRAGNVIEALRAMIRHKHTERATVDAAEIVREVLALLHSEIVTQQIEVEPAFEDGCFVLVDKTQIEQVLLNLILNSIDAMQDQAIEQRRLQVQVRRMAQDEIQVAVRDSGAGIVKDQLNSVFDAFWTTKAHGLGMGLAVCRSIIEAHGGRIWAECNSDRGVSFLFRLPVAA